MLESVDYFGTIDYFSGGKKNNLHEQNFEVYWKTRRKDGGSRSEIGIEHRLKKLENKINR